MFCLSVKSVLHPARIKGASFFQGWFRVFCTRSFGRGSCPRCPARLSGGGTAALAVGPRPREKHRNASNKHRACLMRGSKLEKVGKVLVFYQNSALCMFSALIYIFWKVFSVFPPSQQCLGTSVPQPSDTRNERRTSNTKPSSFQPKESATLKRKYSRKGYNNYFPLSHSELTPGLCCQPSNCLWQWTHACIHVPHTLKEITSLMLANFPQIHYFHKQSTTYFGHFNRY